MTHASCGRRSFLHSSALGAAAGAAVLSGCGSPESTSPPSPAVETPPSDVPWTDVLPAAELPVGTSSEASVGEIQLVLHRSEEATVHAFSVVCTHQGCAVAAEQEHYACPCHGSVFNLQTGAPEGGPAQEPLASYPAEISGDTVRVKV
ncbi:Rieske (2Fe-2S) protein [Nesterenkonia sp. Act20]|uniref:Rieske (2Fe-2S) protein n=1 Tax=Nesterenkonia sp. Act20 TaxID=1483432 RepID=UPI0021000D94|nr:Rieske (2Fe-2S) protein [Nesterenkonia sp. Act20]